MGRCGCRWNPGLDVGIFIWWGNTHGRPWPGFSSRLFRLRETVWCKTKRGGVCEHVTIAKGRRRGETSLKWGERVHELTESLFQALDEIRNQIREEDIISTDEEDLHNHGYSEWSTTNPDTLPVAVAYPRSTEQVSAIARICYKYHVPIIPYSGGSSLEGNFSAPFGGVSIDFAYMDKVIKFNKEDMDIVVQPSCGWQDLNAELATQESGLFFPIDPGMLPLPSDGLGSRPTRSECKNRRHDWHKLLWDKRSQIWDHEGLGYQLDNCLGRWKSNQDETTTSQVFSGLQS